MSGRVFIVPPGTMPPTVLRTDAQIAPGHAPGKGGLPPVLRTVEWGTACRVIGQSKAVSAEIHNAFKLWTERALEREQAKRF